MDQFISDFTREWHVLIKNTFSIIGFIVTFVCISGLIRFGIAVYRRHKGIYPPSPSMTDHH